MQLPQEDRGSLQTGYSAAALLLLDEFEELEELEESEPLLDDPESDPPPDLVLA